MLRGIGSLQELLGRGTRNIRLSLHKRDERGDSALGNPQCPSVSEECEPGTCPICRAVLPSGPTEIEHHLDACLTRESAKRPRLQTTIKAFTLREKADLDGVPCTTDGVKDHVDEPEHASTANIDRHDYTSTPERICFSCRIVGGSISVGSDEPTGEALCIEREPENPHDGNAIIVLDARSHARIGYIPREIARELAPLLDDGTGIFLDGCATQCNANGQAIGGEFQIDISGLDAPAAGAIEKKLKHHSILELSSNGCRLRNSFLDLVGSVWEADSLLLDREEQDFRMQYEGLSFEAQVLLLRLFLRKGPLFRVRQLMYAEIPDPMPPILELLRCGALRACSSGEEGLLSLATVPELQTIHDRLVSKRFIVSRQKKLRRHELLACLRKLADASELWELLHEQLELVVAVSRATKIILTRLQRLYFLTEGHTLGHLQARNLRYPAYQVDRKRPAWFKRSHLLQYEAALEHAARLMDALELGDDAAAGRELEGVWTALDRASHKSIPSPLKQSGSLVFLSRFQAGWVQCVMATAGVSLLERQRQYDQAVDRLQQLLGGPYCLRRRGDWWIRLSINLEHLGREEDALEIAETALADDWLTPGQRLALQRRVLRLGRPPRRWKKPSWASVALREPSERRIVLKPLSSDVGSKCQFMGLDGRPCGVEELALQHYALPDNGHWSGCHCEGGIWSTLFALLLWDELFAPVVDVFRTRFQTAPLDLHTEGFYLARKDIVDEKLEQIQCGEHEALIRQAWAHHGTYCAGLNWDRWTADELVDIALCIGGKGLATVCQLLAQGHGGATGGMPDLLLWNIEKRKAKLVEVKSQRDRLSDSQRAWMLTLLDAGLDAEVFKVTDKA